MYVCVCNWEQFVFSSNLVCITEQKKMEKKVLHWFYYIEISFKVTGNIFINQHKLIIVIFSTRQKIHMCSNLDNFAANLHSLNTNRCKDTNKSLIQKQNYIYKSVYEK